MADAFTHPLRGIYSFIEDADRRKTVDNIGVYAVTETAGDEDPIILLRSSGMVHRLSWAGNNDTYIEFNTTGDARMLVLLSVEPTITAEIIGVDRWANSTPASATVGPSVGSAIYRLFEFQKINGIVYGRIVANFAP